MPLYWLIKTRARIWIILEGVISFITLFENFFQIYLNRFLIILPRYKYAWSFESQRTIPIIIIDL